MTPDEALLVLKASASEAALGFKLELQTRGQIVQLIEGGYFDPILDQIVETCGKRRALLAEAAKVFAGSLA